jgi:hypothetical protein
MPPDGVVALGAHLFDKILLEQALEHVAGGIALELRGYREDAPILMLAGSGENDELRTVAAWCCSLMGGATTIVTPATTPSPTGGTGRGETGALLPSAVLVTP